jgi:hypothetical protein
MTDELASGSGPVVCAQCGRALPDPADRVEVEDRAFCRSCYETLRHQIQMAVARQGADINYSGAVVGGLLGGAAGALVWWGFTVTTHIAFGLVAIVIGLAVGHGVLRFSGGKRARGLQILSTAISGVSFFYATYLVNRSLILRVWSEQGGGPASLPWLPDAALFAEVVRANFGIFDFVFLAIVLYQAWKIPAPFRLPPAPSS